MRVVIDPLVPDAIARHRGSFLTVDGRRGPHIQAWPKKRTKPFTDTERAYQRRFGFAARMAATPVPMEYATAALWSQGSENVPRDLLTAAYMGRLYVIVGPDGQEWGEVEGPIIG